MDSPGSFEEKIGQLEEKLRAQADLYRTLLDLAERQTEEISNKNIDPFVLLQEKKKKIIEEIGQIEIEVAPLRKLWETHREEIGDAHREGVRTVVYEIRTILEKLLQLESRSQDELGIIKDEKSEQIRDLDAGMKAARSYRQSPDESPRFMDESG